jgi:hypothetical protein|eukprot:g2232.t1
MKRKLPSAWKRDGRALSAPVPLPEPLETEGTQGEPTRKANAADKRASRILRAVGRSFRRLPTSFCLKSRKKIGCMYRGPWRDGFSHQILAIRYKKSGDYFAAGGFIKSPSGNRMGYIRIYDHRSFCRNSGGVPLAAPVEKETPYHCLALRAQVNDVRWCPWDNNILVAASRSSPKIFQYDLSHWQDNPMAEYTALRTDGLGQGHSCVAFVERTKQLVSSGGPVGCVRIWDVRSKPSASTLIPKWTIDSTRFRKTSPATAVCTSTDGRCVFAGNASGEIACWDLRRLKVPTFGAKPAPKLKTETSVGRRIQEMVVDPSRSGMVVVRNSGGGLYIVYEPHRLSTMGEIESLEPEPVVTPVVEDGEEVVQPFWATQGHVVDFFGSGYPTGLVCVGGRRSPILQYIDVRRTNARPVCRQLDRSKPPQPENNVTALACHPNCGTTICCLGSGELIGVCNFKRPLRKRAVSQSAADS